MTNITKYVIWLSDTEYKKLSMIYQMENLSDYSGFVSIKQSSRGKENDKI